jgi:hypothetical protein
MSAPRIEINAALFNKYATAIVSRITGLEAENARLRKAIQDATVGLASATTVALNQADLDYEISAIRVNVLEAALEAEEQS